MSDEAAAKQAAIEEKRRAARRARILNASGSRLDAICGLVGSPNSNGSTDADAAVASDEGHQHAATSTPSEADVSSSYDPKVLPLLSESPLLPDSSTIPFTDNSKATKSRTSNRDTTPSTTLPVQATPATSKSAPMMSALKDQSEPAPKANDLKRKQALVLGIILAISLAFVEIKFPKYASTARMAFWAMDMIMWVGVFASGANNLPSSVTLLLTSLFSSNPDLANVVKRTLSQVIGWSQAVYHVLQEWLIAQFIIIMFTAIKSRIAA